jgi:hypothetical protein
MNQAYTVHPELVVETQQGVVYLIPVGVSPVRLNRSASLLWPIVQSTRSAAEAAGLLARQEATTVERAGALVTPFITELLERGVLVADRR